MTKDQVRAVLSRIPSWPEQQQAELAELALEMEAELAGAAYHPTSDELRAIDQALADGTATEDEVKAAFGALKRK